MNPPQLSDIKARYYSHNKLTANQLNPASPKSSLLGRTVENLSRTSRIDELPLENSRDCKTSNATLGPVPILPQPATVLKVIELSSSDEEEERRSSCSFKQVDVFCAKRLGPLFVEFFEKSGAFKETLKHFFISETHRIVTETYLYVSDVMTNSPYLLHGLTRITLLKMLDRLNRVDLHYPNCDLDLQELPTKLYKLREQLSRMPPLDRGLLQHLLLSDIHDKKPEDSPQNPEPFYFVQCGIYEMTSDLMHSQDYLNFCTEALYTARIGVSTILEQKNRETASSDQPVDIQKVPL